MCIIQKFQLEQVEVNVFKKRYFGDFYDSHQITLVYLLCEIGIIFRKTQNNFLLQNLNQDLSAYLSDLIWCVSVYYIQIYKHDDYGHLVISA